MPLEYATKAAVRRRLGITDVADTDDDDLIDTIRGQVSAWLESPAGVGVPVGPSELTELVLDGRDAKNKGRALFVRIGIVELTALTIGDTILDADDWYLRPLEQDRPGTGWPATEIWLEDRLFPWGRANVTAVGTFGFEQMQPEIVEIAEVTTVRGVLSVRGGEADLTGTPQTGQPLVSRWVAGRDRDTLGAYRKHLSRTQSFASIWQG